MLVVGAVRLDTKARNKTQFGFTPHTLLLGSDLHLAVVEIYLYKVGHQVKNAI